MAELRTIRPRALLRPEFLLLGVAALALFLMLFERIEEYRDISQSRTQAIMARRALQSTERVTTLVLRVEAAQRGFLLTGSAQYTPSYDSALREMPAALRDLRTAASDLNLSQAQVESLVSLVTAKLNEVGRVLEAYHRSGARSAWALVQTDEGLRLMNEISRVSRELHRESAQLFTRESEKRAAQNGRALWTSVVGISVVLVVLLIATARLARAFQQNGRLLNQYGDSVERYQLLAQRLESVREEERAHLAREIHDALGQTLTVSKLNVILAARDVDTISPATLLGKLNRIGGSLDDAIHTLRRVAKELRPPLLDVAGLGPAVSLYVSELQERTGLDIQFAVGDKLPPLTPGQEIAAFRICQETLTNVIRHAQATQVSIELTAELQDLRICIQDNGQGFAIEEARQKRSLGLLGMEERARLVNGELSVESRPGAGTLVTFRLPVTTNRMARTAAN